MYRKAPPRPPFSEFWFDSKSAFDRRKIFEQSEFNRVEGVGGGTSGLWWFAVVPLKQHRSFGSNRGIAFGSRPVTTEVRLALWGPQRRCTCARCKRGRQRGARPPPSAPSHHFSPFFQALGRDHRVLISDGTGVRRTAASCSGGGGGG